MFKNLLKISLRNLIKNKAHTLINVLGLSLGISAAIIIYRVVDFDTSFDNYHSDSDRIYRVVVDATADGTLTKMSGTCYPLGENFKEDFNETEFISIVDNNINNPVISFERNNERIKIEEPKYSSAFVQPDYFKIFDFNFLIGNPDNPFPTIKTVVLSRSYAEKYFIDYKSAVGKVVRFNSDLELTVSAVIEDLPNNTDLPFGILISFDLGEKDKRGWDDWMSSSSAVQFFVKAKKNIAYNQFSENVSEYINEHKGENPDDFKVLLQPLNEMHFDNDRYVLSGRVSSWESVYTLMGIGFLLIVAACINFINLNTALITKRTKEIGVRKTLGSTRGLLITQFIAETALISLIAIVLSLGLSEAALLHIDSLIGFDLPSGGFSISLLVFLTVLFILVTILSSLYPAFILSGYNVVKALKGKKLNSNNGGVSLRKSLIVVQLFIAQALIIVVVAVTNQIDYFLNVPIGLQTEAVIEFSIPGYLKEDKIESLRTRLNADNNIELISFSNTGSISNNTWGTNIHYSFNDQPERLGAQVKVIDTTYLPIYAIDLVAGRNIKADSTELLINETALKKMGFSDPRDVIGLPLQFWGGNDGTVVGVVKDFNTNSLHDGIEPVLFTYSPSLFFNAAARLKSVDKSSIDHLKTEWEAAFPDLIFSYQFLDDNIAQFYENEQRTGRVFSTFGFIALSIGAIGLLGLISFMVNSKIKEIGIRKVLGASVNQVVVMLTKDFILLTFIAFVLSVPVAYYFLESWLSDFEYRISLSANIFLVALAVTLIITLSAVSFKAIGSAVSNPVNALKDE